MTNYRQKTVDYDITITDHSIRVKRCMGRPAEMFAGFDLHDFCTYLREQTRKANEKDWDRCVENNAVIGWNW